MRPVIRRSGAATLLAALVAIPTGLPAAAQSGGSAQITHRQSILTDLSPTG
jgi:putative membrane protein